MPEDATQLEHELDEAKDDLHRELSEFNDKLEESVEEMGERLDPAIFVRHHPAVALIGTAAAGFVTGTASDHSFSVVAFVIGGLIGLSGKLLADAA